MTNKTFFRQQAEASVARDTESAKRWLSRGKRELAQRVVNNALSDARVELGKVSMPGAREAVEWSIGQLEVLLVEVSK